jgi:hypothetical protein
MKRALILGYLTMALLIISAVLNFPKLSSILGAVLSFVLVCWLEYRNREELRGGEEG